MLLGQYTPDDIATMTFGELNDLDGRRLPIHLEDMDFYKPTMGQVYDSMLSPTCGRCS